MSTKHISEEGAQQRKGPCHGRMTILLSVCMFVLEQHSRLLHCLPAYLLVARVTYFMNGLKYWTLYCVKCSQGRLVIKCANHFQHTASKRMAMLVRFYCSMGFEVFTQQSSNVNVASLTYSDYKKHCTVKFLGGFDPIGCPWMGELEMSWLQPIQTIYDRFLSGTHAQLTRDS